ncbi:hypothetical protein [Gaetbulibacter jejuensis]|uniref:Uncharacterized protein n=1 Tax=Gaetbulibacter jejuensis TaxID=584607 RepID=A0ABN1JGG7_9FLAO
MKPFLNKDLPSIIFVLSITIFGAFLALILLGEQSEKERLGSYIGMMSMFLVALSSFITISKKNRTLNG